MGLAKRALAHVREFGLISGVAVSVALASTVAGAVLDRVHQVDAEALAAPPHLATSGPGDTQVVVLADWGVELILPLATELPMVSFASQGGASVGLSAADLATGGPACQASRGPLGSLLRFPEGTYTNLSQGGNIEYFAANIDRYDYIYRLSRSDCAGRNHTTVNREISIISGALETLRPIQPQP